MIEQDVNLCRHRIRKWLCLRQILLIMLAAALGLSLSSLIHLVLLQSGSSQFLRTCFVWISLVLVIAGSAWAACRCFSGNRLDATARLTMLRLFPEHRKDLAAWLSPELLSSESSSTRELLRRRLARSLPARSVFFAARETNARAFWLVCAALLIIALTVAAKEGRFACDKYVRQLFAVGQDQPLAMQVVVPSWQWLPPNQAARFEINFDRRPWGPVHVHLLTADTERIIFSNPISGTELSCQLPGTTQPFKIQVLAERKQSAILPFYIFPDQPLLITAVQFKTRDNLLIKELNEPHFPLPVPVGTRIRFNLRQMQCPVAEIGISGRIHGELPIHWLGNDEYAAEVTVRESDSFSLFWQFPDGSFGKSEPHELLLIPDEPPSVSLLQPANRTKLREDDDTISVHAEAEDDGLLTEALCHVVDFFDFNTTVPAEIEEKKNGVFQIKTELPLTAFENAIGTVIGICLTVSDNALAPQSTHSNIALVLLPEIAAAPSVVAEPEASPWHHPTIEADDFGATDEINQEFQERLQKQLPLPQDELEQDQSDPALAEDPEPPSPQEDDTASEPLPELASSTTQTEENDEGPAADVRPEMPHSPSDAGQTKPDKLADSAQSLETADSAAMAAADQQSQECPDASAVSSSPAKEPRLNDSDTFESTSEQVGAQFRQDNGSEDAEAFAGENTRQTSAVPASTETSADELRAAADTDDDASSFPAPMPPETDGTAGAVGSAAPGAPAQTELLSDDKTPLTTDDNTEAASDNMANIAADHGDAPADDPMLSFGPAKTGNSDSLDYIQNTSVSNAAISGSPDLEKENGKTASEDKPPPEIEANARKAAPLSATEWERALQKYDTVRKDLTIEEQRLLREYYRRLRDIQ